MNTSTLQSMLGGIIRSVLLIVCGGLVTSGAVTADQLSIVAGSIAAIAVVAWSTYQKHATETAKQVTVETAVAKTVVAPQNAEQIVADAKAGKF